MNFRFSLQAVLEHRIAQEEKVQREFSEIMRRKEALDGQKRALEQAIEKQGEDIRREQRRGMSFAQRQIHELWIEVQKREAAQLAEQIQSLSFEIERRRRALVRAMQARTMLERLRERELAEFRIDEARVELKGFDEIAARNFIKARIQEKDAQPWERIAR